MNLESIRRQRVPLGLCLLLAAFWLLAGLTRVDPSEGVAVLDAPLKWLQPRTVRSGWILAPPGLLRLTRYPSDPITLTFHAGEADQPSLVTREGIAVTASGTIRYRIVPERVLDVQRAAGPGYRTILGAWAGESLKTAVAGSDYSGISGAHVEDLRSSIGQSLAERFRGAGLELLSCDLDAVRIRAAGTGTASSSAGRSGVRVLLVGLDGADWNIIDPLIQAGRLPNIARLARLGTRGRLHSITPMLSPVIWTSIATGVQPARHGIIDFVASTGHDGERVPVTSTLRKTKALWNILTEQGVSVGVAGWWATFPAEKVNGFIVSDRVAYQLFGARPTHDPVQEGKVFPADLGGLVSSLTVAPETIGVAEIARYVRLPEDPAALPAEQNKLIDDFKTLLAAGDSYTAISLALRERFHPEFQAVYIEGTDTVAHLFMRYAPPPLPGVDREEVQRFGRTVDEYYRHADELVGRLIEAAGPETAIVLCSDHGFRTGENRPLTDSRIGYGQAADWHRKYGIVVLSGSPFKSHAEIDDASVLDITPTILALLGLPVAEDMDGRPILEAFDPLFLKEHPVRFQPSYETAPAAPAGQGGGVASQHSGAPVDPQGDQELKEKLESLGYLRQDTANSHNNRGMLLLDQGKYDDAISEFNQAIRASEDLAMARLNIGRALYRKKDYAAATRTLNEYLARQPRSKEAENLLGNIAMEENRFDEAERRFKTSLDYEPNFTDALNSLGILYNRTGRRDEALQMFQKVVAIDPDYSEALNNIGVIEKERGRLDDAAGHFRRAMAADPEFAGSFSNLALVLEQKGDLPASAEMFRTALQRDPENTQVRANYGALLYTMGQLPQARIELERAVASDSTDPSAHNNLGAVYGRLGRTADEIAEYRRAIALKPDYADVHHNLGLALLKQGETAEGESELRRTLDLDSRYGPAYLNLGRSLLGRKHGKDAVELLSTAIRILPNDPDLQTLLGESYAEMGQKDRAVAAFQASLRLKPDQEGVRQRLREVEKTGGATGDSPRSHGRRSD